MGTAIREDKTVTIRDPTIRGQIPYDGGSYVGYHSFPNRKSQSLTSLKIGSPSRKRNTTMRNRIRSEISEKRKKRYLIRISFCRRVMVLFYSQIPYYYDAANNTNVIPDLIWYPGKCILDSGLRRNDGY